MSPLRTLYDAASQRRKFHCALPFWHNFVNLVLTQTNSTGTGHLYVRMKSDSSAKGGKECTAGVFAEVYSAAVQMCQRVTCSILFKVYISKADMYNAIKAGRVCMLLR